MMDIRIEKSFVFLHLYRVSTESLQSLYSLLMSIHCKKNWNGSCRDFCLFFWIAFVLSRRKTIKKIPTPVLASNWMHFIRCCEDEYEKYAVEFQSIQPGRKIVDLLCEERRSASLFAKASHTLGTKRIIRVTRWLATNWYALDVGNYWRFVCRYGLSSWDSVTWAPATW